MDLNEFLSDGGKILTTVPEELLSDGCGFLGRSLLASYVRLKYWFEVSHVFSTHIFLYSSTKLSEIVGFAVGRLRRSAPVPRHLRKTDRTGGGRSLANCGGQSVSAP